MEQKNFDQNQNMNKNMNNNSAGQMDTNQADLGRAGEKGRAFNAKDSIEDEDEVEGTELSADSDESDLDDEDMESEEDTTLNTSGVQEGETADTDEDESAPNIGNRRTA